MKCKHHGPAVPGVWACPTCLVELREENQALRVSLISPLEDDRLLAIANETAGAHWFDQAHVLRFARAVVEAAR